MKKSRVMVLGIAFIVAAGAAFVAKNMLGERKTVRVVEKEFMDTTKILVAARKIQIGEIVSSKHLKWQNWPKSALGPNYINMSRSRNAIKDYEKAIARASFMPGEPINLHKLIKANQGGVMAAILNPGMRAVSTKIKEDTSAGGFILPNDRVDVILTHKVKRDKNAQFVSNTILSNVRVLAIGQNVEQQEGKKSVIGKTATLELTLGQSEILSLAESMGDLSLALRSLSDARSETPEDRAANLRGDNGGVVRMLKFGRPVQAFGVR